jgi:hypothetical protein
MEILVDAPGGIRLKWRVPRGRRERMRGLIGSGGLGEDEALLIPNATSVHTFGMRVPILVARLDASMRVVDVRRMPPNRLLLATRRARHVLECADHVDLRAGDVVRLTEPVRGA